MTREELKEHCIRQIQHCELWAESNGEDPHGNIYEEHKLILELLEQEPISETDIILTREEYGELVSSEFDNGYAKGYREALEEQALEKEPKTGHWDDIPKYKDLAWYCSECEHFTTMKHNYCPKCGARMIESQESEE